MFIYGLALIQIGVIFYQWYQVDFGDLPAMGGVIRVVVFSVLATIIFSLDMGLGMLKLIKYEKIED